MNNHSIAKLNRRDFMRLSAATTGALWLGTPGLQAKDLPVGRPDYTTVDLGGSWQVAKTGQTDWINATVPGCVHTDLLAAGKIPDP